MLPCEFCRGRAHQLARTATRVWLGCSTCHRTWEVDAERCRPVDAVDEVLPGGADEVRTARVPLARGYLIAGLAVGSALALRILLRPVLGTASPFLLFTPAVAISAFYGGVAPGVLATCLSAVLGSHYFLTAVREPAIDKWDRIALFVLAGGVMTASSTLLRHSRQQLSESLWREQKARAMAEAADRAKDDFLALISHELRTPMSVVEGWMASVRQRRLSLDSLDTALDAVDRNVRILSRLIDDVFDRSRIAAGTLRLDLQLISLATVLRAAIDQLHGRIESAGLALDVFIAPEGSAVLGDSIRLQQVFTNVLSNAIKFTPAGGRISVSLSVTDTRALVAVSDTGSGIAAHFLPHVFDTFRQGPETPPRASQGLGLGLSIARYLIEQHGGRITVASDGPGRGATFVVSLPLARVPRAAGAPADAQAEQAPPESLATIH